MKLSNNFPGKEALAAAGITNTEQARKLSDDELIAIKGIGEKTMGEIKTALASAATDESEQPSERKQNEDSSESKIVVDKKTGAVTRVFE